MRGADGVKCLHCHYAHHLARPQHGNIIGQWTHEALMRYDREMLATEQQQQQEEQEKQEEEETGSKEDSIY